MKPRSSPNGRVCALWLSFLAAKASRRGKDRAWRTDQRNRYWLRGVHGSGDIGKSARYSEVQRPVVCAYPALWSAFWAFLDLFSVFLGPCPLVSESPSETKQYAKIWPRFSSVTRIQSFSHVRRVTCRFVDMAAALKGLGALTIRTEITSSPSICSTRYVCMKVSPATTTLTSARQFGCSVAERFLTSVTNRRGRSRTAPRTRFFKPPQNLSAERARP